MPQLQHLHEFITTNNAVMKITPLWSMYHVTLKLMVPSLKNNLDFLKVSFYFPKKYSD